MLGYARTRRAARQNHERSEEGRADHRDRERERRWRLRERVPDQGSAEAVLSGTIAGTEVIDATKESPRARFAVGQVCIVCGRESRTVRTDPNPLWRRPRRC